MKNIIILGPPGSGKDTQIDEMSKYMAFDLISAGDMLRKFAEKNEKLHKIIDNGGLVDDQIVLDAVDRRLSDVDAKHGVVFDGFPRTLHQAEALGEILLHHGRNLDTVVYIALEEEVIVDRLSRRQVCSICGHNIHVGSEKCSDCGGRAVRRHDDEPAIIINRVQAYLENTLPLVNYYRNKGIIIEINGDQKVVDVAHDIKEHLVPNDK